VQRIIRSFSDRSVLLVFCCTVLGAAAQVFMKMGAVQIAKPTPVQILTNVPLLTGYCLYGCSTGLLVLALRKGQLSILYPIISLTYVWVAVLSLLIFNETMNGFKAAGLAVIVFGVAILGMGGGQK
jgi:multidrug transporter EmrE-like cation transporter